MILTMDGKHVKKIKPKSQKDTTFTKSIDDVNQMMQKLSDEYFLYFFKDGGMFSLSNLTEINLDTMLNELCENQTRKQIKEIIDEIEIESILDEYGLDYADLEDMGIKLVFDKEDNENNEDDRKDDE